jgi:hypothetical protein
MLFQSDLDFLSGDFSITSPALARVVPARHLNMLLVYFPFASHERKATRLPRAQTPAIRPREGTVQRKSAQRQSPVQSPQPAPMPARPERNLPERMGPRVIRVIQPVPAVPATALYKHPLRR